MKRWSYQHRKLLFVIVFLVFCVLLLLRTFVFNELDAAGKPNHAALLRAFFDTLMSTILVSSSVTIALLWVRYPVDESDSETFIQPFMIDECLRRGAVDTKEWYYLGHTGRYIRSQILPFINKDSLARNENKKVKVIILDPLNDNLCDFYATYRNNTRSNQSKQEVWTMEKVRHDLFATVLCMIELQQANSMLEVNAGFLAVVSLFRADISSSMALITQEDSQEPAIRFSCGSHFYKCYRRELELSWRQSYQLGIAKVITKLNLDDPISIRACLDEAGIKVIKYSDEILMEAGREAQQKRSPYISM